MKTIQVSYKTWEALSLIKTRKNKKSMGEVVDLLLDRKKLNSNDINEILRIIDEL